jgi:hypothetical protein
VIASVAIAHELAGALVARQPETKSPTGGSRRYEVREVNRKGYADVLLTVQKRLGPRVCNRSPRPTLG